MNFQDLMRKMVELEQPVQEEKKADKALKKSLKSKAD